MSTFLQPPEVDLDSLPEEPFLSDEGMAAFIQAAADAQEAKEQQKYDLDAQRRLIAADNARRAREEAEIDGRLSGDAEVFRDLKLKPRMVEIHTFEQKVRVPVVQGLLFKNTLAWLAGSSGTFKSFVTADLAFRYGSEDLDYHGRKMTHGRTLLIIAEGGESYADRRAAWEKEHDREVKNVTIYPDAVQLGDVQKEMPALLSVLKEEADAGRPFDLVVFDTQAQCTVDIDENTSEMNRVIRVLHRLREVSGACILVVHHFGKNGDKGMRGSSMIYAAADTVIVVEKEKEFRGVTLSTGGDHGKQKDAIAEKDLLTLELKSHVVGEDYFGDPLTSLVAVPVESAYLDGDEPEPEPVGSINDRQCFYLQELSGYLLKGVSPSDFAKDMERELKTEPGGNEVTRQSARKIWVNSLQPRGMVETVPGDEAKWRVTPRGDAAVLQHLADASATGEKWSERASGTKGSGRVREPYGSELPNPTEP